MPYSVDNNYGVFLLRIKYTCSAISLFLDNVHLEGWIVELKSTKNGLLLFLMILYSFLPFAFMDRTQTLNSNLDYINTFSLLYLVV